MTWKPRPYGRLPATMIIPNMLWLGAWDDRADYNGIVHHGIKAILNVDDEEHDAVPGIENHWRPLIDSWGNEPELFADAVKCLTELQARKIPTLIHCWAGISRSTTVLATWWAQDVGCSFDKAVDVIAKMRTFVDPHVGLRQLAREYLKEI